MPVAFQVIEDLRGAGVTISRDGDMIVLDGPEDAMSDEIVASLRSLKPQIISYLRDTADCATQENSRPFQDEHVGFAASNDGQSQLAAETYGFEGRVIEWLNQHFEPSDPERCAWCKQTDLPEHAIVPFGSNLHGHTWLHPQCWSEWIKQRHIKAAQALQVKGIHYPELRE